MFVLPQITEQVLRARSAVKQLSAEPRTLDWGSVWSLSSLPASSRSESVAGDAGGAERLPVSERTHDSWTDVVHTTISVGTSTMVFDATPHGVRVEIDTPVHGADPLQCPQFSHHIQGQQLLLTESNNLLTEVLQGREIVRSAVNK